MYTPKIIYQITKVPIKLIRHCCVNVAIPSPIANGINTNTTSAINIISILSIFIAFLIDCIRLYIFWSNPTPILFCFPVLLYDAANTIQFINDQGEWVGNASKIKDYIDDSVNTAYTTLKQDIADVYAYVNKYTEYEEFGKSYELSIDFINSQKWK